MAQLVAEQLTKAYRARRGRGSSTARSGERLALACVSLTFEAGAFTAIMGHNGSGKSTLLRTLAGVIKADSGRVAGSLADPRMTGVVFQSVALDESLTIRENLRLSASLYGLDGAADRIARVAGDCDIVDRLDDRVGTLSGGLARRADLARALLSDPTVLLLDEPATGLDPASTDRLFSMLDAWRRRQSGTLIVATHDDRHAGRADRVVFMHSGSVIADDAPAVLVGAVGPHVAELEPLDGGQLDAAQELAAHCARVVRTQDGLLAIGVREPAEFARACAAHGLLCRVGPARLTDALAACGADVDIAKAGAL